ncbi:MAG: glycosyltransferase family 2 protein [Thermoprotei archaeon]|nr:MAG: glycosyltransferase family 2 protein [Thermoprotei archaeon]
MLRVSIVVPSKGYEYLRYLLWGLREQVVRPYEVILVLRECSVRPIEYLCGKYGLPYVVIEQLSGFFTHALNIGKREARGDILIFTDDDAIPLRKWIKRYIELHAKYRDVAAICSRDLYLDLRNLKVEPTPDDEIVVKLYRWLVRPWLESPHPLLKKYRLGVYLTKKLDVVHGPCIPSRTCYSLPFRGVNMSFKTSYVYNAWFPEHESLKRAPGNEQYFGLQLVLKGLDTIYVPNNPVLHIVRQSLSRGDKKEIIREFKVMKAMYAKLVGQQS